MTSEVLITHRRQALQAKFILTFTYFHQFPYIHFLMVANFVNEQEKQKLLIIIFIFICNMRLKALYHLIGINSNVTQMKNTS